MPTYDVKAPDGSIISIDAPEGVSDQQLIEYAAKQYKPQKPQQQPKSLMDDLPTIGRDIGRQVGLTARAGVSSLLSPFAAVGDLLGANSSRAVQNALDYVGMPRPQNATERVVQDVAGAMAGTGAAAKAASKLPGAIASFFAQSPGTQIATAGASAAGSGTAREMGFTPTGQAIAGMATGIAAPIAGLAAYQGGRALKQGAENLIEPLTEEGRRRLVARTLQNATAGDARGMANAAANAPIYVQGSEPTLGQATQNPGLLFLEKTLRTERANDFLPSNISQNQARLTPLQEMAGVDGKLDMFKAARQTAADELYSKAFKEVPNVTPWIKGQFTQLQKMDGFDAAVKEAWKRASRSGVDPTNPKNQTEIAHLTKKVIDDNIETAIRNGSKGEVAGWTNMRDKLVSVIENPNFAPSYKEGRLTYQAMSAPVNQMEAAGRILGKATPPGAATDVSGLPIMQRGGFSRGLADPENVKPMTAEQMAILRNIQSDLDRSVLPFTVGKAAGGSDTQQNRAAAGLLARSLPGGGAVTGAIKNIFDSAYTGANQKMMDELLKAYLNRYYGAGLLSKQLKPLPSSPYQDLLSQVRGVPPGLLGQFQAQGLYESQSND